MRKVRVALKSSLVFLIAVIFYGCFEKKTDDPIKSYRYWAGEKPGKDVQVLNGQYWESVHWTKEYIMYLELIASRQWRAEFIRQNNLKRDSTYTLPDDAPSWFPPKNGYKIWRPSGFDQGSVYLEDTVSGRLFLYEIQL